MRNEDASKIEHYAGNIRALAEQARGIVEGSKGIGKNDKQEAMRKLDYVRLNVRNLLDGVAVLRGEQAEAPGSIDVDATVERLGVKLDEYGKAVAEARADAGFEKMVNRVVRDKLDRLIKALLACKGNLPNTPNVTETDDEGRERTYRKLSPDEWLQWDIDEAQAFIFNTAHSLNSRSTSMSTRLLEDAKMQAYAEYLAIVGGAPEASYLGYNNSIVRTQKEV
jgi:hypothetical protein